MFIRDQYQDAPIWDAHCKLVPYDPYESNYNYIRRVWGRYSWLSKYLNSEGKTDSEKFNFIWFEFNFNLLIKTFYNYAKPELYYIKNFIQYQFNTRSIVLQILFGNQYVLLNNKFLVDAVEIGQKGIKVYEFTNTSRELMPVIVDDFMNFGNWLDENATAGHLEFSNLISKVINAPDFANEFSNNSNSVSKLFYQILQKKVSEL